MKQMTEEGGAHDKITININATDIDTASKLIGVNGLL